MSICQPMTQHYSPIDLPQGLPPSASPSSNSSRIPTPLSVIMQQQQQQQQQHTVQAQPQEPSSDAVNSLRALALSTMRFKRKREGSDAGPPRRPASAAISSVMLDYGSDAQSPQEDIQNSGSVAPKQDMPPAPDSQDSREEGEISDEEDTRSFAPVKTPTQVLALSPVVRPFGQPAPLSAHAPPTSTTSSFMSLASDLPQQTTIRVNTQPPSSSVSPSTQGLNVWSNWVPTEDHVRPGLRMNMEQFSLVKELILDLLGWGVTPEHLVDCGLTREAVFYAFSELNLKLPDNLDLIASQVAPSHIQSVVLPKLPLPSKRITLNHSLPMKPGGSPAVSPTNPSFSQTNPSLPSVTSTLSDMEAQRRQELLARKAVLASRRKKSEHSNSKDTPIVPPHSTSILLPDEPMSIAPSDAVDSFLNSMLESNASASSASDVEAASFAYQTHNSSAQSSKPPTPRPAHAKPVDFWASTTASTLPSSATNTPPLSRRSPTPGSIPYAANGRRGAKRPVAMDFVDDGSYAAPVASSFSRRKINSFAGLNAPRKCVIDLSDSEGEDEDDYITRGVLQNDSPLNIPSSKPLVRPPSTQPPSTAGSFVPPSSKPTPSPSAGDVSLLEKEEQIKHMREMIQKREQDRLRRLAEKVATPAQTPPPTQTPPASAASSMTKFKTSLDVPITDSCPPIKMNQESSEPMSLREAYSPEIISDDQAEEDVVMQNLVESNLDDEAGLTNGFQEPAVQNTIGEPGRVLEPEDGIMPPRTNSSNGMISILPKDGLQAPSAQAQSSTDNNFSYISPFSSYPLLRARMTTNKQNSGIVSGPKSPVCVYDRILSDTLSFTLPDLRPLRTTVLLRVAGPDSFICQYEVPGGGICRDKTCKDSHLSDMDPNDQETARFLKDAIDELARFSASDVEGQLAQVRQELTANGGMASLEDVVRSAVVALCGRLDP